MGLAAACLHFLSGIPFQPFRRILGRSRRSDGHHAEHGKSAWCYSHELKDPDIGIRTGVDCLRKFRQGFSEITDPQEKIKFTLASYNAGIGHVYDAQRLAEKYGKNPNVWEDNVAEYIRLKSDPEYYNDPVCKHGYLRGSETFNYVREVMERYNYYKSKTKHS